MDAKIASPSADCGRCLMLRKEKKRKIEKKGAREEILDERRDIEETNLPNLNWLIEFSRPASSSQVKENELLVN